MSRRKEPTIPNELLDQRLVGSAASAAFEQGGLECAGDKAGHWNAGVVLSVAG